MDGKGHLMHFFPQILEKCSNKMAWKQNNSILHTCNDIIREIAHLKTEFISQQVNRPDLDPIETLQFKIQQRIKAYKRYQIPVLQFNDALQAEWKIITIVEVLVYIDSMPAYVKTVAEANSKYTIRLMHSSAMVSIILCVQLLSMTLHCKVKYSVQNYSIQSHIAKTLLPIFPWDSFHL